PRGGGAGTGDERGADAVGVDGGGAQGRDRVLVEVVGDGDLRAGGAERVELGAGRGHDDGQVAGVDPDGAEPRAGDAHRRLDAGLDVVGVDEEGRAGAHRLDLGPERLLLGVVQQGERVRRGT